MIPFNIPALTGYEHLYLADVVERKSFCGDRYYTKKCEHLLSEHLCNNKVLLTSSCTQALEMAALLLDLKEGDEVIMPSYTFVSTANAFALRGVKICFVDIDPISMNIDLDAVKLAINPNTKAIVPVHYAGMSCNMQELMNIANSYGLYVIEDAAQALGSTYKKKPLGTFGHIACISFHETKNIHCGEGGALVINDKTFIERAEIIREKGTNRNQYINGLVDKYTWVDIGVSGLMSEFQAAVLFAQLNELQLINNKRIELWKIYAEELGSYYPFLKPLDSDVQHNAHLFGLYLNDKTSRSEVIFKLKSKYGITSTFHYIPLHNSAGANLINTCFIGEDVNTTTLSSRILRLPIYHSLQKKEVKYVIDSMKKVFYELL